MPGPRELLKFVANEPVLAILVVAFFAFKPRALDLSRDAPTQRVDRAYAATAALLFAALGIDTPLRAFVAGAVLSQGISNVPAAIMLAEFTHDWRALAFGVSVGGFGVATAVGACLAARH